MKHPDHRQRGKVLLIDKCEVLSGHLGPALEKHGFAVCTYGTARQALLHADRDPPDYILTDLVLPDLSGLALISKIKAVAPAARVVVLTAYASIATAVEAIKLGAVDYLPKPPHVDQIVAALDATNGGDHGQLNGKRRSLAQVEREYINWVMLEHNGNVSAAARALSMHRRTLQRKLSKRAANS